MKQERLRNAGNWQKFAVYVSDCRRLQTASPGAIHYHMEHMTEDYEFRYEQRGDMYMLRCWHNGVERNERHLINNMPEWLRAILDTARVAGAIRPIVTPPPEVILWFRTDDNRNLTEFIELK